MKYFCFRFDVDTYRCIKKGVPNLIGLSEKLGVSFTFFINMGKGTSRRIYLKKKFSRIFEPPGEIVHKLSNTKKLGIFDYLATVLFNPQVGSSALKIIESLHRSGQEVGLHGGSNHAEWQYDGPKWPEEKIRLEVSNALERLTNGLPERPVGFSSPGWQGSTKLYNILELLGFEYVADAHGDHLEDIAPAAPSKSLFQVPTNILGEPGGVGYLENLRARGMERGKILDHFRKKLENKNMAVVYDHPCFAGIQELPLVEEMVHIARSLGFHLTTLKDIVRKKRGRLVS
ncbi:MAG: polysaccharide deacetylase family protein [Nitrospinaceae bacterium]